MEEPEAEAYVDDTGSVLKDCDPEDDDEGGGVCVICMSKPRDSSRDHFTGLACMAASPA